MKAVIFYSALLLIFAYAAIHDESRLGIFLMGMAFTSALLLNIHAIIKAIKPPTDLHPEHTMD
jgi:hypothetical protein